MLDETPFWSRTNRVHIQSNHNLELIWSTEQELDCMHAVIIYAHYLMLKCIYGSSRGQPIM